MTIASLLITALVAALIGWIGASLYASRKPEPEARTPAIEDDEDDEEELPPPPKESENVNLSFEEDDLPLNVSEPDPRAVGILFATNREPAPDYSGSWFSGERGNQISFGKAFVRVPEAHSAGRLEHPMKIGIWKIKLYQFARDPEKHFVIRSVQAMTEEDWCRQVRRFGPTDALVFVHGFNTSFEDALYRQAQIVWDLQHKGVNVLFSWPSRGGGQNYIYDRDSAFDARDAFITVLSLLQQQSNITSVNIVAHSMGNVVALESLAYYPQSAELRIGELVMAAPDIDRDNFKKLIPKLLQSRAGLTLYASSADWALTLSKGAGGLIPRAGDVPLGGPVIVPGLDSIDVTALGTDFFGLNHGTYSAARSVINDMGLLFKGHVRPPSTRLPEIRDVPENVQPPSYWRYPD